MKRLSILAIVLWCTASIAFAQIPILHYPLNEDSGRVATDLCLTDNYGEAFGNSKLNIGYVQNTRPAFHFWGSHNKLRTHKAVELHGGQPRSICFWAYCSFASKEVNFEVLANEGAEKMSIFEVLIRNRNEVAVNFGTKKHLTRKTRGQVCYVSGRAFTYSLKDNCWHHYAIVCPTDRPRDVVIYVDGRAVNTEVVGSGKINTRKSRIILGEKWDGYLSDLRIFNVALTAEQIAEFVR